MEQTKKRATLYAIALFVLLITVFIVTITFDKKSVLEEKTEAHRALLRTTFDIAILDTQKDLREFSFLLAEDRQIVDAFASGNREKLYDLTSRKFKQAKELGQIDTGGFISTDGTHFLRLQNPKKYGDNILHLRPVLAYALQTKKPVTTLDVTLYDAALVNIIPIYRNDHFIGILQTVANINRIQSRLDQHSGIKSAIAFNTDKVKTFLPEIIKTSHQGYSIISNNDPLFEYLPQNFSFQSSNRYNIRERDYIIASRPLQNYRNETIAMMMCAFDITDEVDAYDREIRNLLLFSLILLIIVTLILHYGFSILLRRIDRDARITKKLNQQLIHQLHTDHLTSLPNRNGLIKDLHTQKYYALILLNIDNFKEINDFYGHSIGDETLLIVAHAIETFIKPFPMKLYKMPSDEYAILFLEPITMTKLEHYRLLLVNALHSQNYTLYGINIHITLTMGIDIGIKNKNSTDLLTNADMALKSAKKRHQNYMLYDESMLIKQEYQHNILWSKKVKEAIEEQRFTLYYQPIFDADTNTIIEYEALIRMIDIDGKVISPASFLPAAKQSRLYPLISQFVVTEVFKMLESTHHRFSINLSVDDIFDRPTREMLIQKLQSTDHADRIIFELLESEGIENYSEVSTFISEMKRFGCQIAIDDFGTGYSNFAHILRLDVDILKIDGSLIRNLDTDENAQTILIAVAEFSERLGLKTIAEFVHSEAIANQCKQLGINYLQGYYLGEPQPLTS